MGKRITRVKVNCFQCNKEIEREKAQYDKSKNKRFFCSYSCQFKWRYENTSFPKNKGSIETANRKVVKCNFCGKEKSIFMSIYKKIKTRFFIAMQNVNTMDIEMEVLQVLTEEK